MAWTTTPSRVPYGFHAVPDTDYEFSLYGCEGGASELWRHLAPGVPRIHDWPRQPRGKTTTGEVTEARHVVKRDGNLYIYEIAIPKSEIADLKLEPGTDFGFTFKIGNGEGANAEYGKDKAVTKIQWSDLASILGASFQLQCPVDFDLTARITGTSGRLIRPQ